MAEVDYLRYAQLMGQRNPVGEGLAQLGQTLDDNRRYDLQKQQILRQNRLADMQLQQGQMTLDEAKRKQDAREQLRTGLAGLQPTPNPAFQAQQAAHTPEALNYDRMTPAARQFAQAEAGPGSEVVKGQKDFAIANAPQQPATKPADPIKMMLDYAIRTGNYDEAKNAVAIDDVMRKRAAEISTYGDLETADKLTAEAGRIEKQGTLIAALHKADPTGALTKQYITTHPDVFPGIDANSITSNNGFTQIVRDGYKIEVGPDGKGLIVKDGTDKETWGKPYMGKVGGKAVMLQDSSLGQVRTVAQDASTTVRVTTGKGNHTEFKDVMALRKEFSNLPEVKDYSMIQAQSLRAKKALEESLKNRSNMPVDQTVITTFNKLLDPSSVVRESEYARTPQDLALFSRLKGKWDKIQSGGAGLDLNERQAVLRMITNFSEIADTQYNDQVRQYTELAIRNGFDPGDVIRLGHKQSATGKTGNRPLPTF